MSNVRRLNRHPLVAPSYLFPSLLLLAEVVLSALLYVSVGQAFGRTDTVVMFVLVPSVSLALCGGLLLLAVRASSSSKSNLGPAWVMGSLIGLFGLFLGIVVGPHLAAFYVWFFGAQLLIFLVAYVHRLLHR